MPRRLTHTLVTAAFGAVLLAGCSGGSSSADPTDMPNVEPSSSAPTTSSHSPSPTSSRPSTQTPTTKTAQPNGDAGAPGVPAAARKHTKAGAEAFARHYVDVINETGINPETGRLEPLAAKGCKSCANHAAAVRGLIRKRQHYSGPIFVIVRTTSRSTSGNAATVFADTEQNPIKIISSAGGVVTYAKGNKGTLVFHVSWTAGGWRLSEIQLANYGTTA